MKKKKDLLLICIGLFLILYWFIDFVFHAVLPHNYNWLLWYSAAGLLLTGIALVIQNVKFIYSLFCALFVIETAWIIDFFSAVIYHQTLFGLTEYILSPAFQATDVYFSLYHALIPLSLAIAVIRIKKIYAYGWIGAMMFTATLAVFTYFFTNPTNQINCLHSVRECKTIFSFLYAIENPYRIFIALIFLTVCVFIPTNYALLYLKKKQKKNYRK